MSTRTAQGKRTPPDSARVGTGRKFLSGFGAILILIALYLQFDSESSLDYAAVGMGALGVVLVGLALWASDRVVNVVVALFTGWP